MVLDINHSVDRIRKVGSLICPLCPQVTVCSWWLGKAADALMESGACSASDAARVQAGLDGDDPPRQDGEGGRRGGPFPNK